MKVWGRVGFKNEGEKNEVRDRHNIEVVSGGTNVAG